MNRRSFLPVAVYWLATAAGFAKAGDSSFVPPPVPSATFTSAAEIFYRLGETEVPADQKAALLRMACLWHASSAPMHVIVEGYAANDESDAKNVSAMRAVRIKLALGELGVPLEHVYVDGYGKRDPAAQPGSAAKDRRSDVMFQAAGHEVRVADCAGK